MNEKPPSCAGCPYFDRPMVWGVGKPSARLALIGQNPWRDEVSANTPFAGGSGRVLNRALDNVGLSREANFVTNVVKCAVAPGEGLDLVAVKKCRPLLERELGTLQNCSTILTLGQEAFDAITGRELSIRHNRKGAEKNPKAWLRGSPFKLGQQVVIPAVHPSFIMRTGFIESPLFEVDLARARGFADGTRQIPDEHYDYSPTDTQVREYVDECINAGECGLDIETPETAIDDDELDPTIITPLEVVGLSVRVGEAIGVRPDQLDLLKPLLDGDPQRRVRVWAHNGGGFDFYHLCKRFSFRGVQPCDSMISTYLLWSHLSNFDVATAESIFTDIPYYKNWRLLQPDLYNTLGNCRDTYGCLQIGQNSLKELTARGMLKRFWSMMEIMPLLNDWRVKGVNTDQELANRQLLSLYQSLEKYESWWRTNIPLYDWSSPKQLLELFSKQGLPVIKRKRTNGTFTPSVDDDVLEIYAKRGSQTAKLVQTMRVLRHAGDYFSMAGPDGRMHPRFKPHGQVQGRIQAVGDNVQTIPEEICGMEPRKIVVPDNPSEDVIIVADFSQIEFRLYARQAHDTYSEEQLATGDYIYGIFYEEIFKEPFFKGGRSKRHIREDIPPWKLLVAKSWPLGFIYGRGVPEVGGLPISSQRAKEIQHDFHRKRPAIRAFHTELEYRAAKFNLLQTPFGRMRRFPNPRGQRNEILSFPGQCPAVDVLIENALKPLAVGLPTFHPRTRMLFSVHDSVIVNAYRPKWLDIANFMQSCMEAPIPEMGGLVVPVEIKIGPSWGAAKLKEFYLAATGTVTNFNAGSVGQDGVQTI